MISTSKTLVKSRKMVFF